MIRQVEFLVKLRDASQMIADAANEYLESLAPPEVKEETLDFSKLFWETKQGEKGPFEQTSEQANQNCDLWKTLKAKVKEHKGFWQNNGYKYWFDMKNENVVDRRKVC